MLLIITALSLTLTAQFSAYAPHQDHDADELYQDISYVFSVHLDTDVQILDVLEQVAYVNTSPFLIDTIYIRANKHMGIKHILIDNDTLLMEDQTGIIPVPIKQSLEHNDSCSFRIVYRLHIPVHDGFFGYVPGHYEMTSWYPHVCAYDEEGWHIQENDPQDISATPFASYDVKITMPDEFIVAATGTQVDQAENLFLEEYMATGQRTRYGGEKTVHYIAHHVMDFIWVCDPYFIVQEHIVKGMHVRFFYRPYDIQTWNNIVIYSADALARYSDWFGHLPYGYLNIVQGICSRKTTYPQIVFVNSSEDPLTRLFEARFAGDISAQWFSCIQFLDKTEDAWFSEGLITYATMKYFEDKYGKEYSLIKSSFIPALSLRYFHRANYYIMRTNRLEKPVSTPRHDYNEVAFAYTNSINSKPALLMSSFAAYVGQDTFFTILHRYFDTYRFKATRPYDLFEIIETQTNEKMDDLYTAFVSTTEYCDWYIKQVTDHSVTIKNKGGLLIPSKVFIETDTDVHTYFLASCQNTHIIQVPEHAGEIVSVTIDSTESLLDLNYWNNYHPRRIKIRPITSFELPSFSTYYLYWLPYPWYDSYDGVTVNFYWFGDRFADFDFIRGGHQFMGGINYGFGSKQAYLSVNYQTPIVFTGGSRIRIALNGSHNKSRDKVGIGLLSGLGHPFTSSPITTIENRLEFGEVYSYEGLDSIDWSLGRNIVLTNSLQYKYAGWDMSLGVAFAFHAAGSDYNYLRTTCAVERSFTCGVPCKARLFAGKIFGDAPLQEYLFLCGDLHINWFADLLFSQSGSMSPQEHIHVSGDGNMRGYQTFHIKSEQLYALNLEFPSNSFIRLFADVGYYNELAFDAGISLAITAETVSSLPVSGFGISANFPLYTFTDEPWKLRWSIGFSM